MEPYHQTFTIDIKTGEYSVEMHKNLESLVRDSYDIEEYLIAFEAKNDKGEDKPHFHFIVFTSYQNCTNLLQKLVKDYKLANKSGKRGGKRYYARLKVPIRDLKTLKTYCCKDNNILASYSNETLEELYRDSFKKDTKTLRDKCRDYVETHIAPHHVTNDLRVKIVVADWMTEQGLIIRKSTLEGYFMWIRQTSKVKGLGQKSKEILKILYPYEMEHDFY